MILIVPVLIQDGMFMDGMQFSCVSMNLSKGLGSFWFPFYSPTWYSGNSIYFLEQPPLVYLLQSMFFKILGYSMYTERIYSFAAAVTNAYIITCIWKLIFHEDHFVKRMSWLPVLMWIIIPVCFWSFQNNMLENTMGIFTSLSVYFILKGLYNAKKKLFLNVFLGGTFIFLASFSKGIPGLFPVVVPFLWWLVFRNISFPKTIALTLILLAVPITVYSILITSNDSAYESLRFYFFERALNRMSADVTAGSHFYIAYRIFIELLPDIIFCGILFLVFKKKYQESFSLKNKNIVLFFLMGAAGSLPLMLTLVQKGFYLLPSLAFFAISFAIMAIPGIKQISRFLTTKKITFRIVLFSSLVLLSFALIYSGLKIGKISRDMKMLNDVYITGKTVPNNSIIDIDKEMYEKWNLQFYLYRYFLISVDPASHNHNYYLSLKSNPNGPGANYIKLDLPMKEYDLYKLNPEK